MPRKPKIITIPIDRSEGLAIAQAGDREFDASHQEEGLSRAWLEEKPKTEAQEMTELINEISTEAEREVETPVAEERPVAKAKRAPRAKARPEPAYEQQEAKTEQSVSDKVACPDCGKQMSTKTLRHSHGPNCLAKKRAQQEHQVLPSVSDELIEHEVQKRINSFREDRVMRKKKAIESLIVNAF